MPASTFDFGNGSGNTVHQPVVFTSISGRNDDTSMPRVGIVHSATSTHSTPVGMAPRMRWSAPPTGSRPGDGPAPRSSAPVDGGAVVTAVMPLPPAGCGGR